MFIFCIISCHDLEPSHRKVLNCVLQTSKFRKVVSHTSILTRDPTFHSYGSYFIHRPGKGLWTGESRPRKVSTALFAKDINHWRTNRTICLAHYPIGSTKRSIRKTFLLCSIKVENGMTQKHYISPTTGSNVFCKPK